MSSAASPHTRRFQLLDVGIELSSSDPSHFSLVDRLFGAQEFRPDGRAPEIHARFDGGPSPSAGGFEEPDPGPIHVGTSGDAPLEVAEWTFRACLGRSSGFHIVHAGALVRAGQGVLLVGPPFAGKTTLTLALCQEGFEYFSDDVGPLDRGGLLHPFRRLAGVRLTEGRRDYVAPNPGAALSAVPPACPVAWIFLLEAPFPIASSASAKTRGGAVEAAVKPLSVSDAALEVLRHTLNRASREELRERHGLHPHLQMLTELLDIAAKARCFRLRAGEPASTARMLRRLVDTGAPSPQD